MSGQSESNDGSPSAVDKRPALPTKSKEITKSGISSEIFEELDRLTDMEIFSALKLKPPQFIVLGSENNGKSTLLERLIGFSILPARESAMAVGGACTICPIRVHLRRTVSDTIAVIKIRNRKSQVEKIYGAVAISQITPVLKEIMDDMRNKAPKAEDECFSSRPLLNVDEEIVVEIRSPKVPNLDLLDLPGLCAAEEGAWKLANDILTEEKAHSLCLLVVRDNQINQSSALQLIWKKHKELCEKTTGVYTFLENFKDGRTITADAMLLELFKPTKGRDANHCNKIPIWMGVSSQIPAIGETISIDEKEASTIRTQFPKFLDQDVFGTQGKDLLGISAVRTRVQADFEKYICKNWAQDMYYHLIKHFFKVSDSNLCLGLPMLKNDECCKLVNKLREVISKNELFPDYDLDSMLRLYDEEAITKIVTGRAKVVCENSDWMKLHECKDTFYATLDELKATKLPTGEIDVGQYFEEVRKVEEKVTSLLRKVSDQIIEFADKLGTRFVEAALGNKKVGVDTTTFTWSTFEMQRMMSNVQRLDISAIPSDMQTSVLQMDLIPGLVKYYRTFIDQQVQGINEQLRIHVQEKISKLKGNLVYAHDLSLSAESCPKPKVVLKFACQRGVQAIGNEFFIFWLENFTNKMSKMSSFATDWAVPKACFTKYFEEQPLYAVRKKKLQEMLDVIEVIRATKDLQRKYSESDDYSEVYRRLPEIEAEKRRRAEMEAENKRRIEIEEENKRRVEFEAELLLNPDLWKSELFKTFDILDIPESQRDSYTAKFVKIFVKTLVYPIIGDNPDPAIVSDRVEQCIGDVMDSMHNK